MGIDCPPDADRTLFLECYKALLQHIQYEGNLIWARTAAFLTFNTAWLGFLLSKMDTRVVHMKSWIFVGILIGVCSSLIWIAGILRARPYYKLWWMKLKDLERKISPIDTFQTGGRLFRESIMDGDKQINRHFKLYDYLSTSTFHGVLPLLFLLCWLVLLITQIIDLNTPPLPK